MDSYFMACTAILGGIIFLLWIYIKIQGQIIVGQGKEIECLRGMVSHLKGHENDRHDKV